jgi:uncharacterized protein YfdQ (DUF2303 family)
LSVPRPTNAAGMPVVDGQQMSQEQFFSFLEEEMRKIEQFTKKQVSDIRGTLADVERTLTLSGITGSNVETKELQRQVEKAGEDFLK